MNVLKLALIFCIGIAPVGCEFGARSGVGLRLPNGDVVEGERAFHELGCDRCHAIAGESGPSDARKGDVVIVLGGKVAHIETHGELITSIVNPSHGFPRRYLREDITQEGESKMKNFNGEMTVKQLIDLTEFLQSKYSLEVNKIYGP